jgi:hypothetical protein
MPGDEPDGLSCATSAKAKSPDVPLSFITRYYGLVASSGNLPGKVLYKPIDLAILMPGINVQLGV